MSSSQFLPVDVMLDEHPSNSWMDLDDLGLYVAGLLYCARNLTDGFIPETQVARFGTSRKGIKVATRLVERVKWERGERDGVKGYWVIGYLDHNRSREEVQEHRARMRGLASRAGHKSAEKRKSGPTVPVDAPLTEQVDRPSTDSGQRTFNGLRSTPVNANANANANADLFTPPPSVVAPSGSAPSDSVSQIRVKPVPASRGTRIAADWRPKAETVDAFCRDGIDAIRVLPGFIDYWLGKAGKDAVKVDWEATFRGWVRRDIERGVAPRVGVGAPSPTRNGKPVQRYTPPVGERPDLNDPDFAPNWDFTGEAKT